MNNLKKIMKAKGTDSLKVSMATGYSRTAIYSWINGETSPSLYAARDIALHLGVTDKEIWV